MDRLLKVNNLSITFKTYNGDFNVLRGVDFYVNKGEVLGIVGESGCGKSVTSYAIMNLFPASSAVNKSGSIEFEGVNLLKLSEKQMQKIRGKDISMIFQNSMSGLNPTMKIGEQIKEVILKHSNICKKEAKDLALEMLCSVGISDQNKRYNQYPHQFSGGMRQRVMIAISLACAPKLLIADEPTTSLDAAVSSQVLSIIRDINVRTNTSVIFITHDLGSAAQICDRIAVMYAGKVIETANVSQIFKSPLHPYTIGLLKSIPTMEMNKNSILKFIDGEPPDLSNTTVKGCSFFVRCNKAMKICRLHFPEFTDACADNSSFHGVACWLYHPKYKQLILGKE